MNKRILKCIVLFTLIFSMVVCVLSFSSCNRSYDEAEVLENAKELLQRAEVLNQVYATGDYEVSLYLNGTPIANEVLSFVGTSGLGSKTILLTLSAGDSVALYNTSDDTATLTSASLTLLKLA